MAAVSPSSSLKTMIGIPSSVMVEGSNDHGRSSTKSVGSPIKRTLRFNPFTKIVLIPSRIEYKSAKLVEELWWCAEEFSSFTQSAYAELRLLSTYENIGLREARRKLYQPNEDDTNTNLVMAATGSDDYDEYFTSDTADDDDSDDESLGRPLISSSNTVAIEGEEEGEEKIVIRTSFHKVSSLSIIPESLRHKGNDNDNDGGFPKVSSLDCLSAAVIRDGELSRSADIDGPVTTTSASSSSRGKIPSSARQSIFCTEEDASLQLCVPLEKPALLSSAPSQSSRSRRRASKKSISSASIALCSTILIVAFVLIDRYCGAYMSMK
jgi:hypothetical protein